MLVRAEVRTRWAALAGLALIVAVVSAVVLTAVVGARRTATTLDRYRQWSASSDAGIQMDTPSQADGLAAHLRTLPFVEGAVTRYLVNAFPTRTDAGIADFAVYFDPHRGFATTTDRVRVLSGRLPGAQADNEIVLTELSAREMHVEVGDHLRASTFDAKDLDVLASGEAFPGFHGPALDLAVVGIVRTPDELQGTLVRDSLYSFAAPTFGQAHPGLAAWPPEVEVRLRHGAGDLNRLQQAVDRFAGGAGRVPVDSAAVEYQSSTQQALDALSMALVAFAMVAGAAGTVLVAQAVSRQIGSGAGSSPVWRSLGLTRWSRTLVLALPAVGAAIVGVAAGVGLAVAASPLLPVGLARRTEIHPGVWLDLPALGLGAAMAVLAVAAWTVRSAWRSQRGPLQQPLGIRPSATGNLLARWGAGLQVVTGTRLAFENGGRLSVPVRSALVGATIAVAGVMGAGVVVVSMDSLVTQPSRWGWNWSSMPDPLGQSDPTPRLVADRGLAAVGRLDQVNVSVQHRLISGYAMKPLKGSVSFTVLAGRLPVGPSEVALGSQSMAELRTSVGGTVRAIGGDGHSPVDLRVVGTVVPPPVQGEVPGVAAVLSPDGLEALATEDVQPSFVLTYRNGTDTAALERRLTALGLSFPVFARAQMPGALRNVTQTRRRGHRPRRLLRAVGSGGAGARPDGLVSTPPTGVRRAAGPGLSTSAGARHRGLPEPGHRPDRAGGGTPARVDLRSLGVGAPDRRTGRGGRRDHAMGVDAEHRSVGGVGRGPGRARSGTRGRARPSRRRPTPRLAGRPSGSGYRWGMADEVPGVTTRTSAATFDDTVAKLTAAIEGRGLRVFDVIDHQAAASEVGLSLRPTRVVVFGGPAAGTPLMVDHPLLALSSAAILSGATIIRSPQLPRSEGLGERSAWPRTRPTPGRPRVDHRLPAWPDTVLLVDQPGGPV